jgi:hypothetical protein
MLMSAENFMLISTGLSVALVGAAAISSSCLIVFVANANTQQALEFKHNESERTTTVTTPTQQLVGKPMNGLLIKVFVRFFTAAQAKYVPA